MGAERLIGVERRDRRSGGLHQTSRILSLGRNAVVERSLAEPPADPGGSWGVQYGVRLVGDGEEGKRWGKMKTSLLALLTSLAAHNPVNCDQLGLFYAVSVKLLKVGGLG